MNTWSTKKLEEICDFQSGLWKGKKPPFKKTKVLRNTNFRNGGCLDLSDVAEIEVEKKQLANRLLQKGDLILERSGGGPTQPVGRVVYFDAINEFSFSNFTTRIRIKNPEELFDKYLWRCLNNLYISGATETMQKQTTGIRNLNFSEYKEIEIPLPPIAEQKRIVENIKKLFVKIDEANRLREEASADADALLPSVVHHLFADAKNWEIVKIGKFVKLQGGFAFKSNEYEGSGIPIVRIQNLQNEILNLDDPKCIPLSRKNEFSDYLLHNGDLLIAMSGATTGKIAVVKSENLPALLNQRVGRFLIRDKTKITNDFLFWVVRIIQQKVFKQAFGAAQPNISGKSIEEIEIPLPSIDEQKKIIAYLDSVSTKTRELQDLQNETAIDFSALRQSVLAKAFAAGV